MSEVVTTSMLLEHFDRLAEAPGAVARLRKFVLELAVTGLLSPSSERPKEPSQLRLAATIQNGYAFKSEWFEKTGVRLLRNANVSHGTLNWGDVAHVNAERALEFGAFELHEGDIVLSLDRPFIVSGTKVARVRREDLPCLLLQRVARFRLEPELLSPDYLLLWLTSPHFAGQIVPGRSNGVPHVSSREVESASLLMPRLAEQHRIVAKVDELMALCDELEAAQAKREQRRDRLVTASLHAMTNGEGGDEPAGAQAREQSARFYLEHLPRLTTRAEHVQQLRQTILDLAVCGCLVEQVTGGAPPALARSNLGAGLEQSRVTSHAGESAAFPCALPPGWVSATLIEIATSISDGDHLPPPKAESGIPFLVIGDVRSGRPDFTNCRHVEESYYASLDSIRKPQQGDVLYTLVGSFGIPVVVSEARRFCIQRHIAIIRPGPLVDVTFLARVLASRLVFTQAEACATGIAQKTVPLSGLRRIVVPVPPLAEQCRIVARLDELMALCDELEVSLAANGAARTGLFEASLKSRLADASSPPFGIARRARATHG